MFNIARPRRSHETLGRHNAIPWQSRLKLLAGSVCSLAIGLWLVVHGMHVTTSGYGQAAFSWSTVAVGVILFVAGVLPEGLIRQMTAIKR
jgi:hypothetical protein